MTLPQEDIERAARHIVDDRTRRTPASLPAGVVLDGVGDGYRVHKRVRELVDGDKGLLPGAYKVSGMQNINAHPDVPGPHFAAIPKSMTMDSGAVIDCSPYQAMGVELEVAVRLGPQPGKDGHLAITQVVAVLEVIENRKAPLTPEGLPLLMADGIWNLGVVIGGGKPDWPADILQSRAWITKNGVEAAAGIVGKNLGDPRASLTHLERRLPAMGWPLAEGMIVLTGNLCGEVWVQPGDVVSAEIEGLGRIEVSFTGTIAA